MTMLNIHRGTRTLGLRLFIGLAAFLGVTTLAAEQKTPLHVWGLNMGEPRFGWYALIEGFEKKYPNVDVVIGPHDNRDDLQKLLSGVVGSAPPDLFYRESFLFGDVAARDILRPVDDFIESDKNRPDGLHEEDFLPGLWKTGQYQGKHYGIPYDSLPLVLGYNRKLFREAGLDPNRPPRTWEEWIEYTEKLAVKDESGRTTRLGTLFHVGAEGYERDELYFYITQQESPLFSEDGRECLLDSPEGLRALSLSKSLFDAQGGREAYDQLVALVSGPEAFHPFLRGNAAMSLEDDWIIFRSIRYSPDLELGIAPVPVPAGREHITMSPGTGLWLMPFNARRPKEAWDFIRLANSPEGHLLFQEGMAGRIFSEGFKEHYTGFRSNFPTNEALQRRFQLLNPIFRTAYNDCKRIIESIKSPPISPVTGLLRDEMRRAVDRVSYGDATPEAALRDADRRVQEQLDIFYLRENYPLFQWRWVWIATFTVLVAAGAWGVFRTRNRRATSAVQRHENLMGWMFVSPFVVGLLVLIIGPILFSLGISFCAYDVIHPARFVGLKNYTLLLTHDPLFWKSLWNTTFMVLALPIGMAVSLAIALLLNNRAQGIGVFRTIFYLPAVTPVVATAVLWSALLNPDGLVNNVLDATICQWLGVSPPAWLQSPAWSKPAVVLMGIWMSGGTMILWLAGLQAIPNHLYEAASIDGAGAMRQFTSITLVMLTPYIFFSFVVGIIAVFQIFGEAVVLTKGGPADSTLFYVYYLFNNAFRYFKLGYASAQAWILFAIILILTWLQWRAAKIWVHYG